MKHWLARNHKTQTIALLSLLLILAPVLFYLVIFQGWAVESLLILAAAAGAVFARQLARERDLERELRQARERQSETDQQAQAAERLSQGLSRRLQMVINLNRGLVEAQDEASLMNIALSSLTELVGALGCSFVPVDEWDQPLPPFTYGKLPQPVLSAWAAHLTTTALQERCGNCEVLHSTPGGCPLHPKAVGGSLSVICLPLLSRKTTGGEPRRLGILHLYLPPNASLDADLRVFLDGLLQEIALAVEAVRIREQEMATLRQIQLLHAPEDGLAASLGDLLEGLKQALELDFIVLRLRVSLDERLSGLQVLRGDAPLLTVEKMEEIFNRVLAGSMGRSVEGEVPVWLALPLRLPEGQVLGMLLVGSNHPQSYHPRQEGILQTVTAQVALLVENERLLRSLEYKAVIQERTRLAREIHDGLAQTLAFLKLQAAQMQAYLNKGDLSRLSQVLKDNYQALAEAYLDTRQAIDNLRLAPNEGLESWLEQAAVDFEAAAGLEVERNFQPVSQEWVEALRPEIQAQLLRIVQEALNNVRKHARARRVWASLYEWDGDLVLEIGDDGRGFDAEDIPDISKHGLRGMKERAELLSADFQIISQAAAGGEQGQGTVVRLTLPAYLKETTTR